MMSLDKLTEQTGLSSTTVWRYRKMKMLTIANSRTWLDERAKYPRT